MKKYIAMTTLALTTTLGAYAADHSAEYMAGTLSTTGQVSDGTYVNGQGRGANIRTAAHNVHYVETEAGIYTIESPTAVGKNIAIALMAPGAAIPSLHKQWFMDQLHEGDQVLFRRELR